MHFLPKRIVVAPPVIAPPVHVAPVHTAASTVGIQAPFMWQYTQLPGTSTYHPQAIYPQAVYPPPIHHFPSVYIQNIEGTLSF